MKILVAIANFGNKNDTFRDILIKEYQSMDYDIDIVILSNIPKDLGPGITVKVGLPTSDPWSLPFGHKQLFADNAENYDLFIYTEDDTLLTQKNIESFLEVTEILPENQIAGFLRYEEDENKKRYCSTIHSFYHWDPSSIYEYNNEIFAFFTNEHGALFILTQNQLKKAINSGGFLVPPHEGKYDKLVSAATDPYTQCAMKKMICVSRIDDFLVHHLPDIYYKNMGRSVLSIIEYDQLKILIESILNYKKINNFDSTLFNSSTKLTTDIFDKIYHTEIKQQLIDMINNDSKTILSVGCTNCKNEKVLIDKGHSVVSIPIDNIMAPIARDFNIETTKPDFHVSIEQLKTRKFNYIIFDNILQFINEPVNLLQEFKKLLTDDGYILITIPNLSNISIMKKSIKGDKNFKNLKSKLLDFSKSGLNFTNYKILKQWLNEAELKIDKKNNLINPKLSRINKLSLNLFSNYISNEIIVRVVKRK